jgi:RsiW-degrading membrane proteinase PrsW (M82 family)
VTIASTCHESDPFFAVARKLSHGLFLLLYVTMVGFHIVEFFKTSASGAKT